MKIDRMRGWIVLLICWFGAGLACNLPLQPRAEPLSPPTLPGVSAEMPEGSTSAENGASPAPTATLLPAAGSDTIQLAPTVTPRSTPSGTVNANPGGELTLEYEISWELNPADTAFALGTVILKATGGDGEYTYYRDDIPTGGPQFVYRWGSCKQNPGTFRVDAGDGQSVRVEYLEETPCP